MGGGFCAGLTIGWRLPAEIFALLAFPVFWNAIKEREFFSEKGLPNTICVAALIAAKGLLQMNYSFARFGSPFDFGATYNLAGSNMNAFHLLTSQLAVRVGEYSFLSFVPAESFPFMPAMNNLDVSWLQTYETYFVGFFVLSPATFFAFLLLGVTR